MFHPAIQNKKKAAFQGDSFRKHKEDYANEKSVLHSSKDIGWLAVYPGQFI
jgi:hypothetical protein